MKALFVGLGSIGQRHLRNLKSLLPEVEILAYRTSKNVPFLDEENNPCKNIDLTKFYRIKEFKCLKKALEQKPDLESALEIINLEDKLKKKLCMVGFQYRYHPALIKLKELLETNILGKIINGQIVNGEYLPNWHPYEDYRISYASQEKLGGGAILTQIHDFDYSIFLFGMPKSVFSMGGKLSSLDIDVEDSVTISTMFNYQNSPLVININLDYISWPSRRYIKLFGEDGSLECDLNKNNIEVKKRSTNEFFKYDFSSTTRNDIFMKELKNFIAFVEGKEKPLVDLNEGIKSLKFALAAKNSLKKRKLINIS